MSVIDLMKVDVEGFEPNDSGCEELLKIVKDMGFVVHEEIPKVTLVGHNGLVYQYQDILFKHMGVHHIPKP